MCHNSRRFWNRSEERMSRTTWGLMFSSSRQGGQSKLSICIILYSWYVSSKALREGGKIGKWMGSSTKVAILEWVQVQGIYSRHGGQKEESGPKRRDFDAHARTDERVHLEQDCHCWAEDMHGRPNTKFGLHRGDVGAPDIYTVGKEKFLRKEVVGSQGRAPQVHKRARLAQHWVWDHVWWRAPSYGVVWCETFEKERWWMTWWKESKWFTNIIAWIRWR